MKTIFTLIMLFFSIAFYAQDQIYVHTATASNITGHITYIDHPDLNGNPNACLSYTHNWNPNGGTGIYNDNVDGLWYDGFNWTIFNEDTAVNMVEGASFNIYIASAGRCIDHVATAGNTAGNYTDIDDSELNGSNPGPYAFMSHYWNPNTIYNTGIYGMWYNTVTDRRSIYNEDTATPPAEGTAFKVLIPGGSGLSYTTHAADAGNISGNYTVIDHPDLNGNPNATFLIAHYWGISGAGSQIYLDANVGVWYTGSNWSIYTEDGTAMPEGIEFDIVIAPQEVLAINDISSQINVSLYPNPVSTQLTVETTNEISQVVIYNILGQQVLTIEGISNKMNIDVSKLPSGTYLAKVVSDGASKTIKLIKV